MQNFKQSGAKVEQIRQALRDGGSESGEEFDFPEEGTGIDEAWESCDDD